MLKIFKKIYDLILGLIVTAVVLLVVLLVGVRLFGIKPFTVLSGSMEPKYHVGSVIYVKDVDPRELQVGDPLTFSLDGTVVTHEIIEIIDDENPANMFFVTKGLTNNVADGNIPVSSIVGKPIFTIPYLGYVATYIQEPAGLVGIVCAIVILLVLSFVFEIPDGKKGEKTPDSESSFSAPSTDPEGNADKDINKNKKED